MRVRIKISSLYNLFLTSSLGHDVRNRSTKQFQAIASLSAVHRWCLTGTPIQNSLEDLGALVAFLKVPILENVPTFRKYITNQLASNSRDRFSSLRMLLGTICLRRTRELLHLPDPVPQIRKLCLTSSEQAEYDDIVNDCRKAIDMAVSGHRKSRVNSTMLESLLKLRLFCNNGSANRNLQIGPTGIPTDADEALSYLQQINQASCIYCTGPIYSINNARDTDGGTWIMACSHLVCRGCLPQHRANKQVCPCTSNLTPQSCRPRLLLAFQLHYSHFNRPTVPLQDPRSSTLPNSWRS
jgi:SWI/SNF-related matrix-associated actin-dependent regulator of chromatin subfamily A3